MPRIRLPTKKYIISRTTPIPFCGCWVWDSERSIGEHGYVVLGMINKEGYLAHQATYEIWTGKKPPRQGSGLEIHHKCGIKICCNPDHLELRTISSHRLEHGNQYTDATECIHGHKFTDENTYTIPSTGARQCKICMKNYATEYYNKNKSKWTKYNKRANLKRLLESS